MLRLADALIAGAVVVSVVGLYQYFFTDYVEAVEGVRRILSLYDSPNHLSLYLGRVIPISFCLAAFGVTRWRRIAHGLALIPLVLCLYLTYSRGAWLLGLPAALLFIGFMRGRWGRILALGGLVAALLALAPVLRTPRIATLLTLQSGTNFLRLVLWEGTARMIAANPVFGVGLGNFMRHYPRYMLAEGGHERVVFHPHNLLLDTWTSLGIPGLAALAWIQIAFFRLGLQLYRRLTDRAGIAGADAGADGEHGQLPGARPGGHRLPAHRSGVRVHADIRDRASPCDNDERARSSTKTPQSGITRLTILCK